MSDEKPSFFARLKLALAFLFSGAALPQATLALPAPAPAPAPALPPPSPPPAAAWASGLYLLAMLQREGRLLDFLQEDVTSFPDADVGAAARVVHQGCRKVLAQYVPLEPVLKDAEGASVTVPAGFDANRFRLTGNVTGPGPWQGALRHHGWCASEVKLPPLPTTLDPKVLAPAEVELP